MVHFVHSSAFAEASNRPYINIMNVNSLWSTNGRWMVFGYWPNVCRIGECCFSRLCNMSTLNNRFVFACHIRILFTFRCKLGLEWCFAIILSEGETFLIHLHVLHGSCLLHTSFSFKIKVTKNNLDHLISDWLQNCKIYSTYVKKSN